MMNKKKQGFIPVMLTPFKDNGEIDYNALTQLTEFYLEAGASGLFANCLSSEMFELTDQEKIKTVEHIVKVANGVVPVLATGTFGGPVAQQTDFVKQIYQTGIQAVIIITGLLAEENDSDTVFNDRIFDLMDQTEKIPLGFYECPVPYKRVLSADQLKQFVSTNRVIYHKDTCLDINQIKDKLKAVEGYNFGLYDAYMGHAVESLKAGVSGLSCIQGNFFPELIVWLCKNYNDENLKVEVDKVQQFLIDNMDVMHEVYPVVAKYYLQKRGLNISTFTRREVGNFSAQKKHKIENLQHDYTFLQQQIA